VHPTHAVRTVGCWAPKDTPLAVAQTSGRQRLNIHGAIDLETGRTRMLEVETVDAVSTIKLMIALLTMYPRKRVIHLFLDNARYHHAKLVQAWLARPDCWIKLHFIPTYSAHPWSASRPKPIERLWGLTHKHITHNKSRWCTNGVRFEPSSWFLQSPPPNGDRHTQTCHSIEHIASDLRLGAVTEQTPSAKSSTDDGLVAVHCCLDQAPSIVTRSTLPAYSTMLRNDRNVLVTLSHRCLAHHCCRTRGNDNRSPRMSFGHSFIDCLTIVRAIGCQ